MKGKIKRFYIDKLFGKYKVDIRFDEYVKILVGENGIGKTTILNAFYYTISGAFDKLKSIDFERIVLEFSSGKKIDITRAAVFNWRESKRRMPIEIKRLQRYLRTEDFDEIIYSIKHGKKLSSYHEKILDKIGVSYDYINYNYIERKDMIDKDFDNLLDAKKTLDEEINGKIIYLPTYRRVEQELLNLGIEFDFRKRLDNINSIQFGLEDVGNKIENIKNEIKAAYKKGFSKVSAEILLDMIENKEIKDIDINNFDKLKVIVDRIEDEHISKDNKAAIKEFISNPSIANDAVFKKYSYFLNKFVKIYEEQSHKEKYILEFIDVCNSYLLNKEYHYNESEIDVIVKENKTGRPINPNKLSSGEKQIISLFAKLYLEEGNEYYILFDEPELSLSIEWQQKLLPDIVKSEKCNFLLAVTHSPFIFENELDEYAVDLDVYMEECYES